MLDSLFGRSSFYSKCKSLIKQTRNRIEVVRRKRNATEKFLRKDVADLLVNGLDSTAFARADSLINEAILSSCYEFIDHVCEIVLKHLPVLQKLRECPEDCREAVASLMFAAARFSDVPELRDLRDLFQERYGSALEFYVNQKLVENITTKPPTMEKKIQLLQDIALEFSVIWDSRNFRERMSNSVADQKQQKSPGTLNMSKNKVATPPAVVTVERTIKDEATPKKLSVSPIRNIGRVIDGRHQKVAQLGSVPREKDDLKHKASEDPDFTNDKNKPSQFQRREHKAGVRDFEKNTGALTPGKRLESVDSKHEDRRNTDGITSSSPVRNKFAENSHVNDMKKQEVDTTDGPKSNFRGGIPPPYMKPRKNKYKTDEADDTLTFTPDNVTHKAENLPGEGRKNKHKTDDEVNDTLTFTPPGSNGSRTEKLPTKADSPQEKGDEPGRFTEIYYKGETAAGFMPRRRSHRRRQSRSPSTQDEETVDEERILRRVSTSRRKNGSKKGLQILVADDDNRYKKDDEEEKMIDKLLLHYSKQPSSGTSGKSKRKTDSSKSPHDGRSNNAPGGTSLNEEPTLPKSRSFCLPSRQETEPVQEKVFARAASFNQDTPAKHVHPKLPDYDDLAARFAALRAAKG